MVVEGGLRGIGSVCQLAIPSLIHNVHQNLPLERALSPVLRGRYPPNGSIET